MDAMGILLEKGARAKVDQPDNRGRTPLSHAAEDGQVEAANLLLEKGAGADQPDDDGRTPFSHAAQWGCVEAMNLLLEKGTSVGVDTDSKCLFSVDFEDEVVFTASR